MRRWWLAGLLAFVLAESLVMAEGPREFLMQNWTAEDGLPANTVSTVAQTPDGYLWIGTFGGLVRFDGVRFVPMTLDSRTGLGEQAVVALHVDEAGQLWIAFDGGQLVRLNGGVPTVFSPPSNQTADRPVHRIAQDRRKAIWMVNFEGRLSLLNNHDFREPSPRSDYVTLCADTGGRIWVASPNSLEVADGTGMRTVWSTNQEPDFKPEALSAAMAGGCWVAGNGQVRRFEGGQWQETRGEVARHQGSVLSVLEDRDGNVWVGTYGAGVACFGPEGKVRHLNRERGLATDLVRYLFEDRDGNIWVGLEGKGLTCIRPALFTSYGPTEGLTEGTVLCGCEGEQGEIWVGMNGDGVHRIRDGRIQHYGREQGLENEFVWSLCRDRQGRIWAGTWGGGLFRFDGDRFVNTATEIGETRVVLRLHEDAEGRLWLGQRLGPERRIEVVDGAGRRSLEVPGTLPRLEVRAIAQTADGSVWHGTMEEGLWRWHQGRLMHYGEAEGLPAGPVSCLEPEAGGGLWFAIPGVGLGLWNGERFQVTRGPDDAFLETINQVTDDGLGCIWLGLRSGVLRVIKTDLMRAIRGEKTAWDARLFTRADGLPSNQCSGKGFRARDGRIWFLTADGVSVVDPLHVAVNPVPPAVRIEEVTFAGRRLGAQPGGLEPALAMAPLDLKRDPEAILQVSSGSGAVEFRYTALSFVAPERVRFRYQLTEIDEVPVEAGGERAARYSYLPPGTYQFRVTARNEGGEWNEHWASVPLEVLPQFYQAWWFQAGLVALLLAGSIATARIVVTRRMRHRLALLEQQRALEQERSRISQDLHDDLGTSLTEINLLSSLAASPSSSPEDVRASLGDISEKSLELVKALDEIVWAVNPKNDSLPNLANYLCLFAKEFLRPTPIQCRLDVAPGLPNLPLNAEQRHSLFLVTKEALANAAKHSAATELVLRISFADSAVVLIVEDNGGGFDPAALKRDRNGLKNIGSRMRQLGGRAEVRSQPGQGTRVELVLPVR